ncbi:hypothetical protein HO133_005815 [Letharia lupina]|uniref:Uncharacterized protein n=1 Tax=Letharia lupina TaxID=560253 RepID=A0A8H6F836_9LECA|nr:uncharacterized protein HO133_005815 [Letharia lupina]KAF6218466.1 hypothetical protein HO133_005815 [Letharia lupina]
MQPQKILSLMALFAIGAQALPPLPKANSMTVRTDADEAWEGGTEKRTDADEAWKGGTEKRTDADEAWDGKLQPPQ